jgi:GntR family transcriptional regulator/MocR family aminotransferase
LLTKGLLSVPEQNNYNKKARSNRIGDIYNFAETTGFPFIPLSFIINKEFSEAKYELNDGQPDLRLHPIHEFSNGMALP